MAPLGSCLQMHGGKGTSQIIIQRLKISKDEETRQEEKRAKKRQAMRTKEERGGGGTRDQ